MKSEQIVNTKYRDLLELATNIVKEKIGIGKENKEIGDDVYFSIEDAVCEVLEGIVYYTETLDVLKDMSSVEMIGTEDWKEIDDIGRRLIRKTLYSDLKEEFRDLIEEGEEEDE
jgi:hypothetical protein